MATRVAVPMVSPWSEQRDQQLERELKTIKFTFPADHDQQKTIVGAPITKASESMVNVVEDLDKDLWHELPEDVLPKIFARLPFRSLFKIRLLSKAWGAHMESTAFQLEATSEVLSTWESYSPLLSSSMQNMGMVAYSRSSRRWESLFSLSYLFAEGQLSSSRWRMQSIAGALLCLKQAGDPGERGILVTNPVLKSWRVLPPHGLMTPFLPAYEILHLITSDVRDSSTYKVISISQDGSIRDPHKKIPSQVPQDLLVPLPHLRAEIYDSATGAWTVDESGPVMPMDLHNVSSVYLDGVVYFSLATSRYQSFHLLAYNVMRGSWTTIPCPQESCSLVQLARCGASVMLVLSFPAAPHMQGYMHHRKSRFGPSTDSKICEGCIYIYEIGPDLKISKVSEGPNECIQGVKIVEGISGDEDSIYLQAFGRPLVVVFNVKQKLWSTVAVRLDSDNCKDDDSEKLLRMSSRHIGPWFNWLNSTFQPGLNPFVTP